MPNWYEQERRERAKREDARRKRISRMHNWTALCALSGLGALLAGAMEAYVACGIAAAVALVAGLVSDELYKRL